MKHTPGPWTIPHFAIYKSKCNCDCGYIFSESDETTVCDVYIRDSKDKYGQKPLPENAIANAKLIAAAPDLLDALLDMVSDHENLSPATIENARKAIEKAVTW